MNVYLNLSNVDTWCTSNDVACRTHNISARWTTRKNRNSSSLKKRRNALIYMQYSMYERRFNSLFILSLRFVKHPW